MKKIILGSLISLSLFAGEIMSINKGLLITGADFDNYENKQTSMPLLFSDSNKCVYLGNAKYNISTERVSVSLYKKSCMGKEPSEINIEGFVISNNSEGIKADKVIYNKKVLRIIEKDKEPAYIDENFKIIEATLFGGKEVDLVLTK